MLKVLVSAYACNPEGSLQLHPGEDLTGWKLMLQLSRFHEIWVITHRYNEKGIREALLRQELPRVRFLFVELHRWLKWLYRIEFAQRIYYYLWQIKAWRLALLLHRKVGFDLAHHLTFGNYWMPSFIGAFLKVPFIWGPVGGGQITPKGLLGEYSLYGILAESFRGFAQWIGLHLLISRRICLRRAKAVLVCNYETRDNIPKKFQGKVHLFPVNGISQEDLDLPPRAYAEDEKEFVVLTAGRFVRLKGFGLALRAFGEFSRGKSDVRFDIVGSGPEEGNLKGAVSRLNIENKVRFLGWLPRDQVLQRMRESDVFFFPSFRDGGGAVVVEAMASGLPVVCLDSGGPGFYIEPEWGIKVQPKNPGFVVSEMARALAMLHRDQVICEAMGRAAKTRAEKFNLWDNLGNRLRSLYGDVLSGEIQE